MGAVHSNKKDESKLSLADRRYRVSAASKVANSMQRRSTRKLGSVALEVQQEDESQPSEGNSSKRDEGGEEEGEGEQAKVGEQYQQQQQEENNSTGTGRDDRKQMRERLPNRQRSQTLLHLPLSRTENAANATILLTRTQRVLIENSWKRVKKAAVEGIGANVFHNVLIAQPDIKLLFGLEKVPQGRLKYEGQFRRHAGLLNRTLEYVVKNLQYTDKLGQHFKALGKKHCQMNGGRAFPANYWDTFLECILQSVLETDGSTSGRFHRCREAAFSWRNLVVRCTLAFIVCSFSISFIVQQMRRGFDDERLMRKRFSASLMGLRGSALRDVYYGGDKVPSLKAISGRPRPSLFQHSHGSLGSLEMMSGFFHSHRPNHPNIAFNQTDGVHNGRQRQRAVSAVSAQISQVQQNLEQKQSAIGNLKNEKKEQPTSARLQPRTDGCPPSARSASWCAEESADEFRRLNLNDGATKRATRSELFIDDKFEEAFYTPPTKLKTDRQKAKEGVSSSPSSSRRSFSPSPRIISTVQLLLSAANSEPFDAMTASERTLSSLELPNDCGKHSKGRHSFSEFANDGRERLAAIEASKRMLEMVKKNQLHVVGGEKSPTERTRRLSAI
ncbi:hypothetical protein niasHT_000320 [Heterodera trifolii]|uniref:Globin domain-containing protein n=1 Tax=Heterodera trifolii TaxID=157864 RepID=A0ABD2LVC9_9BILA